MNYGAAELAAARAFGADTLRFQVSQPGLDPSSAEYDAQYASDTVAAIETARADGFVVMIMMQDESISGETMGRGVPTAETLEDWERLDATFGSDRGVLYELFNEPQLQASSADWALWANGDTTGTLGMQTMITQLRADGSQNVFVLDGLATMFDGGPALASTLSGVPPIADGLGRVVYAVHPYPHGSADESQWDANFGVPSRSVPVDADEWSAQAGAALGLGSLPNDQVAVNFLNYIRRRDISLGAGAFDVQNFMPQSVPGWVPTNYDGLSATSMPPQDDAGLLVEALYQTDYGRPITAADGVTASTPGSHVRSR